MLREIIFSHLLQSMILYSSDKKLLIIIHQPGTQMKNRNLKRIKLQREEIRNSLTLESEPDQLQCRLPKLCFLISVNFS